MVKKFLLLSPVFFLVPNVVAEFYKVEVSRLEKDLYKTSDGIYIETKYCHEYARREEAILSYEQYSYDNKLIFRNGTTCEVKKVFK